METPPPNAFNYDVDVDVYQWVSPNDRTPQQRYKRRQLLTLHYDYTHNQHLSDDDKLCCFSYAMNVYDGCFITAGYYRKPIQTVIHDFVDIQWLRAILWALNINQCSLCNFAREIDCAIRGNCLCRHANYEFTESFEQRSNEHNYPEWKDDE